MSEDLIRREDAIEALRRAEALTKAFGYHNVIDTIRELPSVDIDLSDYSDRLWRKAYEQGRADAEAEIIHCRECKFYDITYPYGTVNPDAHHCKANDSFYGWDHFCAYGERKDDAEIH